MDSLKLLLEIQENRGQIKKYNNILKDESYVYTLKKMKREFQKNKVEFKQKCSQIEKIKLRYEEINEKLTSIKEELENLKFKLYNYTGCDLKFIEGLQKEIDLRENNMRYQEDEALELLEKEEKLGINRDEFIVKLSKLKNDFYNYKEAANKKITDAKQGIIEREKSINKIEKLIPEKLLKEFNSIFNSTGIGAGKLNKYVCSACKMRVSSLTIDSIKKGSKIVYCDNCGRIIYYNDMQK